MDKTRTNVLFSLLSELAKKEMAEKPEDLNLPNAVITRIIKDAVRNLS